MYEMSCGAEKMATSGFSSREIVVMRESGTPRTAIFDSLILCLKAVKSTQLSDALFVIHRLRSSALLPELLPLFNYGTGITAVFGIESGFSMGAKRGIRHRVSIAVRDRPPSGSWSGVLYMGLLAPVFC